MPTYVSPGVYVIENDISDYAVSINSSVVGIVGFGSKGPVNKATLITSPQRLVETFGEPSESLYGQGLEGAMEILETTNSLYFVRAASSTATEASALVSMGACPAIELSSVGAGVTNHLYLEVQVKDNDGTNKYTSPKAFTIPSGTVPTSLGASGQSYAMLKGIGSGELASDHFGVVTNGSANWLVGSYAGENATLEVSAWEDSTKADTSAILGEVAPSSLTALDPVSAVAARGTTFAGAATDGIGYLAESLWPGEGYNLSTLASGRVVGNSVEIDNIGGPHSNLTVNDGGAAGEVFKVSFLDGIGTYIEDQISTGTTNAKSDTIMGHLVSGASMADFTNSKLSTYDSYLDQMHAGLDISGSFGGTDVSCSHARFIKLVNGSYSLADGDNGMGTGSVGDDGVTDNDSLLIGNAATEPKEGLYALDDDLLNISVALVPGVPEQNVQNALVTLAEASQNFIALVAPPEGVGNAQNAIDWSNGLDESRTAAINSSYAAIYWPWVKTYSVWDKIDRYLDPAIFGARQMVYTDSVADPWFAPAGFVRGRLTKPTEVEVKLNQGDRDAMYSGGNVVNPIVAFPQQGITIFGQRTTQRDPSALDRINVRRMMILIRKMILASTRRLVFEPNDAITWERVSNIINPMLSDIKTRRGITEFKVVCDESTNTPLRIDRNEMWCKVIIKPTKTAEMLIFEVNLTSQSAKI